MHRPYHFELNQGDGWVRWPTPFWRAGVARTEVRKYIRYVPGAIQARLVDSTGYEFWSCYKAN